MKPGALPFFEHALPRLDELAHAAVLCAFDFDGTLAPIVTDPEAACIPADALQRMRTLAELAPVAVITGRSLEDIRQRLGFKPKYVVGNHGLQGLPGEGRVDEDARGMCAAWEKTLAAALRDHAVFDPGIRVENKGYSLSVHYRRAADHRATDEKLSTLLAALEPPARIMRGKCVFNVLPPNAADKGVALDRLLAASGAAGAIFVGDDVTDEDVFRLGRSEVLSVRIGYAPDTTAAYYLEHRDDIVRLLDALIASLRKAKGGATSHNRLVGDM